MTTDMETGTIKNTAAKANRDGDDSVRMLDVEMSSPSDVQSVQLVSIGGVDFHPLPGAKVVIAQVGGAWKMAIVLEDGIDPDAGSGEKFIYSQDASGEKAAEIKLRNTGDMELNGADDYAVAYNDLKAAFDKLKSDFNLFVTTKYNPHGHPTAPVGPVSPPSLPGASSSADMSGAKVDTVRFP